MNLDENGYFKSFSDDKTEFKSLQELIRHYRKFLQWEFQNKTEDKIGHSNIIFTKKGTDFTTGTTWDNKRKYNPSDFAENVKNHCKDDEGEWWEEWEKKGLERWAKK